MATVDASSYLVLAEKKYTDHLIHLYTVPIYNTMVGVWQEAVAQFSQEKRDGKRSSALKIFQERLKMLPQWNQGQLNAAYDTYIASKYSVSYVKSLLEAVFVVNIKVYSLFQKTTGTLHVSIPDARKFYHLCLVESGRRFFSNPYVMENRDARIDGQTIQRNMATAKQYIHDAIVTCVNNALPLDEMLAPKPELMPVPEPVQPEVELSDDGTPDVAEDLDVGLPDAEPNPSAVESGVDDLPLLDDGGIAATPEGEPADDGGDDENVEYSDDDLDGLDGDLDDDAASQPEVLDETRIKVET